MNVNKLGECFYGRDEVSKKIVFLRNESWTIHAVLKARKGEGWEKISEMSEDEMIVQSVSPSKMQKIFEEAVASGKEPEYPPDQRLSKLSPEGKEKLMDKIFTKHTWVVRPGFDVTHYPNSYRVNRLHISRKD